MEGLPIMSNYAYLFQSLRTNQICQYDKLLTRI